MVLLDSLAVFAKGDISSFAFLLLIYVRLCHLESTPSGLFPCRPGRRFVGLHLDYTFSWNVGHEIVILKERIHLSVSVWRG